MLLIESITSTCTSRNLLIDHTNLRVLIRGNDAIFGSHIGLLLSLVATKVLGHGLTRNTVDRGACGLIARAILIAIGVLPDEVFHAVG